MATFGLIMTWGIAEKIKMIWPMMEIQFAYWIVLYLPQYSSAIHAPKSGVK